MTQRVVGLDLGSASIKVVHLESRGRGGEFEVLLYDEEILSTALGEGSGSTIEERYAVGLAALRERGALQGDVFITGLPGDEVSLRTLSFPFSDRKKIEQTLPFELESEIPFDIEEIIFSWNIIEGSTGREKEDGIPETEVKVCFVRKETMESHLKLLEEAGVDPRHVTFDALILDDLYQHLFRAVHENKAASDPVSTPGGTLIDTGPDAPKEAVAIVDIGHRRTQICIIVEDRVIQAQTILHGGADATRALSREIKISLAEAEKGKRKESFIEVVGRVAQFPEQRKISEVLKRAYTPVIRRMRQIFQATISKSGARVLKVILLGGGSRVLNLEKYFSEVLNVQCIRGTEVAEMLSSAIPLSPDASSASLEDGKPEAAAALGYALSGILAAKDGSRIDFRVGEYGWKGELDFIRERSVSLVAWASALVLLLVLSGAARMWTLGVQEAELIERQIAACENITGQRIESPTRCLALIRERIQGQSGFSLPVDSAADMYLEVSRRIPAKAELQRKVTELDANLERIRLKVTTTDFDAVDKIVSNLSNGRCFSKVEKGKARNVKSKVEFNVNIRLDCESAPGKTIAKEPSQEGKGLSSSATKVRKPEKRSKNEAVSFDKKKKASAKAAKKRPQEDFLDRKNEIENDAKPPRSPSAARKARREKIRALREKRKGLEDVRIQSEKANLRGGRNMIKPFQPRPMLDGRLPTRSTPHQEKDQ